MLLISAGYTQVRFPFEITVKINSPWRLQDHVVDLFEMISRQSVLDSLEAALRLPKYFRVTNCDNDSRSL